MSEKGSDNGPIIGVHREGLTWCKKHNHEVDYELVRVLKPKCIKDMNGCGNCPESVYEERYDAIRK